MSKPLDSGEAFAVTTSGAISHEYHGFEKLTQTWLSKVTKVLILTSQGCGKKVKIGLNNLEDCPRLNRIVGENDRQLASARPRQLQGSPEWLTRMSVISPIIPGGYRSAEELLTFSIPNTRKPELQPCTLSALG